MSTSQPAEMILLSASPHAPKKGRSSAKPLGLNLAKGEMGYFNSSRNHILLFKVLFTENSFFDHSYTGRHSVECAEHKVSFSYTYLSCPVVLFKDPARDSLHLCLYTALSNEEKLEFSVCLEPHSLKLNLLRISCEAKP